MSTKIHPYLIARLIAVQEAFNNPGYRVAPIPAFNAPEPKAKGNNWNEVIKKDEDEDGQGGGRGTMRGHRGKNAEHAKAAMRRLTRNR